MRLTSWLHRIHVPPINSTNLAGAVDVVVIRHLDGTLKASPFYVRFGKLGVIRSEGKDVYIHVNGKLADLHMILSDEGQAYFEDQDGVDTTTSEGINSDEGSLSDDAGQVIRETTSPPKTLLPEAKEQTAGRPASPPDMGGHLRDGDGSSDFGITRQPRLRKQRSIDKPSSSARKKIAVRKSKRDTTLQLQKHSICQDFSYSDGDIALVRNKERGQLSLTSYGLLAGPSQAFAGQRIRDGCTAVSSVFDDPELLLVETHVKRGARADFKGNSSGSPYAFDQTMCRCASDSDLDKNEKLIGQATFFLKDGRRAISEFRLADAEDRQDSEVDVSVTGTSSADVSEREVSGEVIQNRFCREGPPVYNLSCLTEAKWYIRLLEQDVSRIDWASRFRLSTKSDGSPEGLDGTSELKPQQGSHDEQGASSGDEGSKISSTGGADRGQKSGKSQPYGMMRLLKPLLGGVHSEKQADANGVYLNEALSKITKDPEMTSAYFSRPYGAVDGEQGIALKPSGTMQNGNIVDPIRVILGDVSLSDCGGLATAEITSEQFDKHLINEQAFIDNPDIIYSQNLVVRINNRYYNWLTAAPMILSAAMFRQKLPQSKIDCLVEKYMPTKDPKRPSSGWWIFGRGWTDSNRSQADSAAKEAAKEESAVVPEGISDNEQKLTSPKEVKSRRLCLTSKELESLNLKYGENEFTFSVTTPLQGTSVVTASVFLFHETDKFVISDIDGTITRSDVIGHILPLVGRDWSHDGIAEFFCAIADNGYNFIYVSSRSIGQSALTRDYLRNLKQRGFELPRGPALLSPDSLFNALYREVVAKKPEEFKINCLKTIGDLFPRDTPPFYAGFGNRVNDQWAYTAVGIPLQRIFTINPSGVVKHHASDFSSYKTLHEIVDQLFPPVLRGGALASLHGPQEYSSFTYWRDEFV